jgi:hypothetical protein
MSANNEQSPWTRDWLEQAMGASVKISPPLPLPPDAVVVDGVAYRGVPEPLSVGHAMPATGFSDHEIRECVNELRRIALEYGGSQQLRERLAGYIAPILRGERRP